MAYRRGQDFARAFFVDCSKEVVYRSAMPTPSECPKFISKSALDAIRHKSFYEGKLIQLVNGQWYYLNTALDSYHWIAQDELENALIRVLENTPPFHN